MTCIILTLSLYCTGASTSVCKIEPFISGEVANVSPEPKKIYYSNPDWAWDDKDALLLHDVFGGAHGIVLMRRKADGWQTVAKISGAMHSHLIYLPDQELYLILGVRQKPKSICLWHSSDGENWSEEIELFGGANYHAGSTPWAIHDGRLFVPFEIKMTHWGSYQYGAVHAALDDDLTDPASWSYTMQRVPWTALPGCSACGGLEGNLIVAPDGNLYNILRIPAHARLGKARWNGLTFEWEGIVQGVHNQSKHELFTDPVTGKIYLLANGWSERLDKPGARRHGYRNALCLWEATEPDLSRFRLLRVVKADRNPLHAFSYVAAMLDPNGRLWIAERNGDDQTESYHDTNRTIVRTIDDFRQWIRDPALIAYGTDQVDEDGIWRKESVLDGLLISHFPIDGKICFPLTAKATIRVTQLAQDETRFLGGKRCERISVFQAKRGKGRQPIELLGFATCDLIVISAFRLRDNHLTLWSGDEEWRVQDLAVGKSVELELSLLSPTTVSAKVNGEIINVKLRGHPVATENVPTNIPSHPSIIGILPRDDSPEAEIGCVEVLSGPTVVSNQHGRNQHSKNRAQDREIFDSLDLRVLVDGVSAFGKLQGRNAPPVPNLASPETGVMGGFVGFRDEYTGQLYSGKGKPSIIAPLRERYKPFSTVTFGGFVQALSLTDEPCIVAALAEELGSENSWDKNADYFAITLAQTENGPTLGIVHQANGQKIEKQVTSSVPCFDGMDTARFFVAVSLFEHDDGLEIKLYQGIGTIEKVGEWNLSEILLTKVGGWRNSYFVALIGLADSVGQLRSSGGLFLSSKFLNKNELAPIVQTGYMTLLDEWPLQQIEE